MSATTIEPFYYNRSYATLRILCQESGEKQYIACTGEARLMLRSGNAVLDDGKDSVNVSMGSTVFLNENLIYSLKTTDYFDILIACPTSSDLLYPLEIR
jgi:hypothetical protein